MPPLRLLAPQPNASRSTTTLRPGRPRAPAAAARPQKPPPMTITASARAEGSAAGRSASGCSSVQRASRGQPRPGGVLDRLDANRRRSATRRHDAPSPSAPGGQAWSGAGGDDRRQPFRSIAAPWSAMPALASSGSGGLTRSSPLQAAAAEWRSPSSQTKRAKTPLAPRRAHRAPHRRPAALHHRRARRCRRRPVAQGGPRSVRSWQFARGIPHLLGRVQT